MPTYNSNGEVINKYELKVNPVSGLLYLYLDGERQGDGIDIGHEGLDVSDVVSFYQSDVTAAANYLDSLGSDWVSYVELNDQHYSTNGKHASAICRVLLNAGLVDKVINLGDMIDSYAVASDFHSEWGDLYPKGLFVIGNHDVSASTEEQKIQFYEMWVNDVFTKLPTACVFDNSSVDYKSYYYYDNESYKIRFLCLDPHRNRDKQAVFFKNVIDSTPDDWTIFILTHEPSVELVTEWGQCGTVDVIVPNVAYQFALDKRFGAIFCGHDHRDIIQKVYGYVDQAAFLCDRLETFGDGHYTYPPRSADDNSAQSITLISINPTQKKIKFYRIGAEHSQIVPWSNHQYEITYSTKANDSSVSVEEAVMDGYWIGTDGRRYGYDTSSGKAKTWLKPIEVDATKTYYAYHADGTAMPNSYTFAEFDADGKWIDAKGTVKVNDYVRRLDLSSNAKWVILSSSRGDEYVISTERP